jgi:hypothetical protein
VVDPGLAGGLRAWLEDGVSPLLVGLGAEQGTRRIDKRILDEALGGSGAPSAVSLPLARGALVDALFRQQLAEGPSGDPMADALAALACDDRRQDVVTFVAELAAAERAALAREVALHAASLAARWPRLAPSWLPRPQDPLAVSLAGGRVVLAGVVDLALGAPAEGRASVCLVELKSGPPRPSDAAERAWYALLETVRSGAPPFRVATFYSRTGQLEHQDVTDELLAAAVQRTLRGLEALGYEGNGLRR